jgi:hypothetical protein
MFLLNIIQIINIFYLIETKNIVLHFKKITAANSGLLTHVVLLIQRFTACYFVVPKSGPAAK